MGFFPSFLFSVTRKRRAGRKTKNLLLGIASLGLARKARSVKTGSRFTCHHRRPTALKIEIGCVNAEGALPRDARNHRAAPGPSPVTTRRPLASLTF